MTKNRSTMPDETYKKLLEGNRVFVDRAIRDQPDFFENLARAQTPKVLWIGCADSRVPANEITNTVPGEIFVHRNIANMVIHADINCLSVLEYAVSILKVEHVIVCGHYGCGGVKAAMSQDRHGMVDSWLSYLKDVYRLHKDELNAIADETERRRRWVELNVIEQVANLCATSIIQESWYARNLPHVHGWVYDLNNGIIRDLNVNIKGPEDLEDVYLYAPVSEGAASN